MRPDVSGKTFLVVGLARSGCAAGALLKRNGCRVLGVDDSSIKDLHKRWDVEGLSELAPHAFDEIYTDGNWPETGFYTVVISPGVPLTNPKLAALPDTIEIIGELELGARFCKARQVAITGTNGKSTTTELTAHLFRQAGHQVLALGNVGRPFCEVADTVAADSVVILEVSSFQLETVREFKPEIGIVLNLAPDHQDRYKNLNAYFEAKSVLAKLIPADGFFITCADCEVARSWSTSANTVLYGNPEPTTVAFFDNNSVQINWQGHTQSLIAKEDLALKSPPNLLNALASTAIGLAAGLKPEAIAAGLKTFQGLAHRHELVATRGGVNFINDSKATNVHAVCSGLDGYAGDVVLIAGGSGKGEDYTPLSEVMGSVRHLVHIGAEGPAIAEAVSSKVPVTAAESMEQAVALAADLAEPAADVLLSPACASFDMFANYRVRGLAFAAAALKAGAIASKTTGGQG